ncbi:hypothetical protein [Lacunimicrobium album]
MKSTLLAVLGICFGVALMSLSGCGSAQNESPAKSAQTEYGNHDVSGEQAASLAKLSSEDRLLAEAQGYCAVSEEPLGSMGPPIKLIINDQPVFVCCKGCNTKAQSNPDATLAKVAELKSKVMAEAIQ